MCLQAGHTCSLIQQLCPHPFLFSRGNELLIHHVEGAEIQGSVAFRLSRQKCFKV